MGQLTMQDEDCARRPCSCECHTMVEEPSPHVAGCAFAGDSYVPEANHPEIPDSSPDSGGVDRG